MSNLSVTHFNAQDQAALQVALDIRIVVFVDEQNVPIEMEQDEFEGACTHFLAWADGKPIGTARLLPQPEYGKVQRVAVLKEWRGKGVGEAIMKAVESFAKTEGTGELRLGAQITAIPFYARLGYEAYGNVFMDANIPHKNMRKSL